MRKIFMGVALCATLAFPLAMAAQPGPAIVGEHVFETFETTHPYTSSGAESAQLTTSETIVFPNATYVAPHFSRFQLAPGDLVVVRSPDNKQKWTYTGNGRQNLGVSADGFYATHIKGDTAIIELYTAGADSAYGYRIDHYGRGFNDDEIRLYWDLGLGEKMNLVPPRDQGESICTADDTEEAKCYQISEPEAYDKARAVARLLLNGNAHCTGWLVGDEGHLMTNEHCITSQAQTNSIDFEFMAEGAACATNCAGALACPGTIEASGGTFIVDSGPLDYALVLPDTSTGTGTNLPVTYGFMRLRDTGTVLNERIYLVQHPAGWGKRFAMTSTYPEDVGLGGFNYATSLVEAACAAGGPAEVGYWGDTQGGSSGSPVLGYSDHRVVAIHHCRGGAFCTTGNPVNDERNRGVPIDLIITDLGANLPNGAVCDPPGDPSGLSATPNGDNQVDLAWTAPAEGATSYNVYRAFGACPQTVYQQIATGVTGTTYSDTTVSGGTTYSYAVKTFDSAEGCESAFSNCDDALATGVCTLAPTFDGLTAVDNNNGAFCSTTVTWSSGTPNCGATTVYNVYRSTTSGFTPDAGSLISACETGSSYVDNSVMSGVQYYYVVRAEDDSGNGAGLCGGGNEDTNTVEASTTPSGPDVETFFDDMESGTADWTTTGTGGVAWAQTTALAHSPTTSWFSPDEGFTKDRRLEQIADVAVPAEGGFLSFWHRFNTETNWDGGVLEYSTNGGTTWFDILAGNGGTVPANAARFLANGYTGQLNTSASSPISGRNAWHGDNLVFQEVRVNLNDFAGGNVRFRWRLGCDGSIGDQGWWVDDVRIATATMCTAADVIYIDGFESGDTSAWSSVTP